MPPGIRRMYERMKLRCGEFSVADVRPLWLVGVEPHSLYPQECFYRAYRYATHIARIAVDGIWLVHGECSLAFGCHAWVELPDGLAFDGVLQQFFRTTDYYGILLGQPWYRFTPDAAALISANMPKTEDGEFIHRWDTELKLPWFRGVVLEIDEPLAGDFLVSSGIREEWRKESTR